MKVVVDRDACISCGFCESVCPEVFKLDDENISMVIQNPIDSENVECSKESEYNCPTSAIHIE